MNLLEMSSFLGKMMGDAGEQYHSKSEKVICLNTGMIDVCSESLSLLTSVDGPTSVGDNRYPLPVDFLSLKDVQIVEAGQRYQLVDQTYDEFEEAYGWGNITGRPCHYRAEFGATSTTPGSAPGDIWLGPTPDATVRTLRIVYYQRCTKFIGDGSDDENAFELQEFFHKAVCYKAAMDLSLSLNDSARWDKFAQLYSKSMADAMGLVSRMNRTGPMHPKRTYDTGRATERRRR